MNLNSSPRINRTDSAVLTYHSIDDSDSVISVRPDVFRDQMRSLVENRVAVVPLSSVFSEPGAIALTFDDGFENFYRYALPLLAEYRLPATVFAVSGHVGRYNDWPSQPVRGIPRLKLMNSSELRAAAAAVEIGAHTVGHPSLPSISIEEGEHEMLDSKSRIEDTIGMAVTSFAYPYGDSSSCIRAIAGRHFSLACGTSMKVVTGASDRYDVPRVDVCYLKNPFWFRRINDKVGRAYLEARGHLRKLGRHVRGGSRALQIRGTGRD